MRNAFMRGIADEDPRIQLLDDLYNNLPRAILVEAQHLTRESDHRMLFQKLWRTCEALVHHLCDLLNTDYLAAQQPDEGLERRLRGWQKVMRQGNRGLSLGQYLQASREFSQSARNRRRVVALLDSLNGRDLPPECGECVRAAALLKDARECGVPAQADYLSKYLKKHMGTPGKTDLDKFLGAVVQLRNSDVHPAKKEGDAGGLVHNPEEDVSGEWCRAINVFLAPAVRELLLWSPVFAVLTRLQQVELLEDARPEKKTVPIEWKLSAQKPPLARLVGPTTSGGIGSGTLVLVEIGEPRTVAKFVSLWSEFPRSLQSMADERDRHRRLFAEALFGDGVVDTSERSELGEDLKRRQLAPDDVETDYQEVWATYRKASAWAAAVDAPDLPVEIRSRLPTSLRALAEDDLRAHLRAYLPRQQEAVLLAVRESETGVLTTGDVAKATSMPEDIASQALERLRAAGHVAQLKGKALWRVRSDTLSVQFAAVLERMDEHLRKPEEVARVPAHLWQPLWTLFDLCIASFRDVEGEDVAGNLAGLVGNAWSRWRPSDDETEDVAAPTESTAVLAPVGGTRRLHLQVDGEVLTARGLTGLVRQLDERQLLRKHADALIALAPYEVGRTRCIMALEPKHAKTGTDFGYPIEVDLGGRSVFFEANFAGPQGVFHLSQLLRRCGFDVPTDLAPEVTVSQEPEVVSTSSNDALRIEITYVDEPSPEGASPSSVTRSFSGGTVRELLTRVVEGLIEIRRDRLYECLPYSIGRTRYLAAHEPIHKDGKPFTSPAQVEDVYVEINLAREDALNRITELCSALGLECYSDDESDSGSVEDAGEEQEAVQPTEVDLLLQIDGMDLRGATVREFFTNVLEHAAAEGWMDHVEVPWRVPSYSHRTSRRYLVNNEPVHENDKPFRSPMPFAWPGRVVQVELNFARGLAVAVMTDFVESLRERAARAAVYGEPEVALEA